MEIYIIYIYKQWVFRQVQCTSLVPGRGQDGERYQELQKVHLKGTEKGNIFPIECPSQNSITDRHTY